LKSCLTEMHQHHGFQFRHVPHTVFQQKYRVMFGPRCSASMEKVILITN